VIQNVDQKIIFNNKYIIPHSILHDCVLIPAALLRWRSHVDDIFRGSRTSCFWAFSFHEPRSVRPSHFQKWESQPHLPGAPHGATRLSPLRTLTEGSDFAQSTKSWFEN
jgi:hypothetical protein